MAGLTREGFTPLLYEEIVSRISTRLRAFRPNIDLSTESPDGQNVEIFSFITAQAWSELGLVYNSYNPNSATGEALRNIGMLTGLQYGAATRSQVQVNLTGTAGTIVPKNSIVADAIGNQFTISFDATIPTTVQAVAKVSGGISVGVGAITTIVTSIDGWIGVTNTLAGRVGGVAQTEAQYRNLRNKTVLRNFSSSVEVIKARLFDELKIEQVSILNNDTLVDTLPDGTPPQTIHITVGEIDSAVTDQAIAQVILKSKGLGCPTYGSTTVVVNDSQNNPHSVSFSKAIPKTIFMDIEVLFLDEDYAGAKASIEKDLLAHINSLEADEDVIWSRLFGIITPYAKAQVNKLELSSDGITYAAQNITVSANEYAYAELGYLNVVVANVVE